MKIRQWSILAGLLLSIASAATGQVLRLGPDGSVAAPPRPPVPPEYKPPKQAVMFEAIWARRSMLMNARYRLMVVEVLSPKPLPKKKSGAINVKVKALADLGGGDEDFKPFEFSSSVSLGSNRELAPKVDKKYYLASVYFYERNKVKTWRLNTVFYIRTPDGRGSFYYYMLPLERPDGPIMQVVGELAFGRRSDGKTVKNFERMLAFVAHEDAEVRGFAASYASVNGWGYSAAKGQSDQPDAFAKVLLGAKDAETRGRLAGAYKAAGADLLPRDADLLEKVFHHSDPNVTIPALQYNLRHASKRGRDLAPLVREVLTSTGKPGRLGTLRALADWGEPALVVRAKLDAIARGEKALKATPPERITALRTLLKAKVSDAEKLVLATLADVPSAVALEHAVEEKLYAVAPAIIRAARARKLTATPTHLAALSLLTRRFPGGTIEQFDAWWSKIEKTGRAEGMIDTGFLDPAENAEARRLVEQLGSERYRERSNARKKLSRMGTLVLPALMAATKHADPAVAMAAGQLVAEAEAVFKTQRNTIAGAANAERSTAKPLASDEPQPVPNGIVPAGGLIQWKVGVGN